MIHPAHLLGGEQGTVPSDTDSNTMLYSTHQAGEETKASVGKCFSEAFPTYSNALTLTPAFYRRLPLRTSSIVVMQRLSHAPPAANPAATALR